MLYIQKPISNDETTQIVNTMSGSTTTLQKHKIACIVTNEETQRILESDKSSYLEYMYS